MEPLVHNTDKGVQAPEKPTKSNIPAGNTQEVCIHKSNAISSLENRAGT